MALPFDYSPIERLPKEDRMDTLQDVIAGLVLCAFGLALVMWMSVLS